MKLKLPKEKLTLLLVCFTLNSYPGISAQVLKCCRANIKSIFSASSLLFSVMTTFHLFSFKRPSSSLSTGDLARYFTNQTRSHVERTSKDDLIQECLHLHPHTLLSLTVSHTPHPQTLANSGTQSLELCIYMYFLSDIIIHFKNLPEPWLV